MRTVYLFCCLSTSVNIALARHCSRKYIQQAVLAVVSFVPWESRSGGYVQWLGSIGRDRLTWPIVLLGARTTLVLKMSVVLLAVRVFVSVPLKSKREKSFYVNIWQLKVKRDYLGKISLVGTGWDVFVV